MDKSHEVYIQRCLEIASKGLGNTAPNPMVGCVIVHNELVIGEGYHQRWGEAHAETNAINSVRQQELLKESVMYVNLEPCSHFGKTPPCTDLIISKGIPHVVIGAVDSNVEVAGKGIAKLRKSGCLVEVGILEEECRFLNRRFFTFHEKKRPYIILKWAQTLDGFIDNDRDGVDCPAPWITNDLARSLVHKWRAEEQSIIVGTNTALKDNPQLNVRDWTGKDPLRIVLDRTLRLPENLNLFDGSVATIVFTEKPDKSRQNIDYIPIDFSKDVPAQVLEELYGRNIQTLIVEGGAVLLNSFISAGLWDEARVFIGEKVFGKGIKAPVITEKVAGSEDIEESKLLLYFRSY
jgi:diaminohydroxyphosphoribosylaminopyrimidine deaminase / 5-amino-6-(5-phosphoribosylamino)uracil reductase